MSSALLFFCLGLTLFSLTALFVVQMRRQVQAAWTETGRVYQRSTARMTAVGDLLDQVLFETDASQTLIYTNRAFHDLTGFQQRDLQGGLTLGDLLQIEHLEDPGAMLTDRSEICCRDGARIPVAVRLSAIRERDRIAGWRGLLEPLPVEDVPVEAVLGDILKDFNNCTTPGLPAALERGLGVIGRHLRADRCYHYAASQDGSNLVSFSQWYAPGVSPMSGDQTLPGLERYRWTTQRLEADGAVMIDDVGDLDPAQIPECGRWREQGITSLLVVPLRRDGDLVGIVGCESLGRVRRWRQRDRQLLEAMAQICERVQNQERTAARLDDANHRAGTLAELLPEPLAVADRDGAVVAWNAALAALSGRQADEMVSRPLVDVLEEMLPGAGAWLQAHAHGNAPASSEFFQLGDAWLQLSLRPLEHREYLLHVCDVTTAERNATLERTVADREQQLQDAQAELLAAQKDAAVARMVTGLAHELNTPVGVGLTAASHLQQQAASLGRAYADGLMRRSEFEEFLTRSQEASSIIVDNLQRAADLVSGMRQAAVDQVTDNKRLVPLKAYLADVLMSLGPRLRERHVAVDFRCPDDLALEVDPGALYRVVSNLVMNAVQHAFDGMLVGRISIDVAREGDRIALQVRDDGQGMTPEQIERIYEPFYTTARQRGGLGLGLHIVFSLVTRNFGGQITCHSTVGQGTSFRILLPVEAPTHEPEAI